MPELLPKTLELPASLGAVQLGQPQAQDQTGNPPPPSSLTVDESTSSSVAQSVDDENPALVTEQRLTQPDTGLIDTQDNPEPTADESAQPQIGVNGEPREEAGENTSTGYPEDLTVKPPASFFDLYWPYMLVAVAFAGWLLSQLFGKRGPSFNPPPPRPETEIPLENQRGQFKKSERFLKPDDKDDPVEEVANTIEDQNKIRDDLSEGVAETSRLTDSNKIEGEPTNIQQANTMQFDQPDDDEFDFDLNEEGADSDVFSFEDADEIEGAADSNIKANSSKRFKTEADVEAPGVKSDELHLDDEFDDEDSQLSLADSDAEFGFDLDDEGSNKFLDSGSLAAGAEPEASQVDDDDDDDLADLGLDDIEPDGGCWT